MVYTGTVIYVLAMANASHVFGRRRWPCRTIQAASVSCLPVPWKSRLALFKRLLWLTDLEVDTNHLSTLERVLILSMSRRAKTGLWSYGVERRNQLVNPRSCSTLPFSDQRKGQYETMIADAVTLTQSR